ncbi:MAG TPA: hypothetical protein PLR17_08340 [Acetomicrobium flavidum]|uniref:Uncharacterized protein n=1 Tax=Acetomicrobium flavidum TaxID=49896 RepID=A0ABY1JAF4_9BACT|nr:hypothetical protein SAMN05444368_0074 [Acetomicrobium flavidum]HOJ83071.1 hypothetical protein [Acetomicrobium flavidum]HOM31509.1 hypothetical protein [Acetomicrobium flavidum]HPP15173.1 hypothetical protein [Acetomicrobium flavidum]HPU68950.1 hypothetical protein [Acetomicrobium flavidum]
MCKIVTDEEHEHIHSHTDDPLEIAEMLRETLAEELDSMSELAATWHMIDDETIQKKLMEAVRAKQKTISLLFEALQESEKKAWG